MPKSGCVHSTVSPREDGRRRSGWKRLASYSSFWDLTRQVPPHPPPPFLLLSLDTHTYARIHTQTGTRTNIVPGRLPLKSDINFSLTGERHVIISFLRSSFIWRPQRSAAPQSDREEIRLLFGMCNLLLLSLQRRNTGYFLITALTVTRV